MKGVDHLDVGHSDAATKEDSRAVHTVASDREDDSLLSIPIPTMEPIPTLIMEVSPTLITMVPDHSDLSAHIAMGLAVSPALTISAPIPISALISVLITIMVPSPTHITMVPDPIIMVLVLSLIPTLISTLTTVMELVQQTGPIPIPILIHSAAGMTDQGSEAQGVVVTKATGTDHSPAADVLLAGTAPWADRAPWAGKAPLAGKAPSAGEAPLAGEDLSEAEVPSEEGAHSAGVVTRTLAWRKPRSLRLKHSQR